MTTITKKQILLSKDVLSGKKLYWAKTGITEDIENAINNDYDENVKEFGYDYASDMFFLFSIENKLRKMGYRIWGDK